MAKKFVDITGQKFGRWEVLHFTNDKSSCAHYWMCKCECGTVRRVLDHNLKSGKSVSCGCYKKEALVQMKARIRNSATKDPLYVIWSQMKANAARLGVKVSDEWFTNFRSFRVWLVSNKYKKGLYINRSIPRVGYCAENCYLSEHIESRKNNRFVVIDGERKTLSGWADAMGMSRQCVDSRLKKGWSELQAILTPKGHRKITIK